MTGSPLPPSIDQAERPRYERLVLLALLLGALAVRMAAWYAMPNYNHADEIYQYREQAFRLVTGYGVEPWEYQLNVRSWVVPGVMSVPMFVSQWLTGDTIHADHAIALGLVLISLLPVYAGWVYGRKAGGLGGAIACAVWMLCWYELVYYASKGLMSPIAGHLIVGGALLWGVGLGRVGRRRLIGGGVLLALAATARPHLLTGIGVLTLYAAWVQGRHALKFMAAGTLGTLCLVGAIDMITHDYPFQWMVHNFRVNVVEDVASGFGVTPWYEYARMLLAGWRFWAPLLLVLFIAGFRRLPVHGTAGIVMVIAFSFIGHKDDRFIYPAVLMALLLCGAGLAGWVPALLQRIPQTRPARAAALAGLVLLLAAAGYERSTAWPFRRYWTWCREGQSAMRQLHLETGVQSVLIYEYPWYKLPGYATLRRDVPLIINEGGPLEGFTNQYTHVLSGVRLEPQAHGLELIGHWPVRDATDLHLYLYRSTRPFEAPPDRDLNAVLLVGNPSRR